MGRREQLAEERDRAALRARGIAVADPAPVADVYDESNPDDWIYPLPSPEQVRFLGANAEEMARAVADRDEAVARFRSDPEFRARTIEERKQDRAERARYRRVVAFDVD